ncbi:MAG: DUF4389 domain-containing protein [Gammaproteobacteria bacterium]
MQEQLSQNFKNIGLWRRIFFMLLFAVIIELVGVLLWLVVLLQIGAMLLTGKVNDNILNFGRQLSVYLYHILLFLTFNTDELPFPFAAWNLTEAAAPQRELDSEK